VSTSNLAAKQQHMRIAEVIRALEHWAPPTLQEEYDNCGLQVGNADTEVEQALLTLDCTESVVDEAVQRGCGLVITHHPVIFKGLKSLAGDNDVQRTLLAAVKHQVAIYAIHTNLDNVRSGVSGEMAERMGLKTLRVLDAKPDQLCKLAVFVPEGHADQVRNALFSAGAGQVGAYDECSFNLAGTGTFRAGPGTEPFVGKRGVRHSEPEIKIEVIAPVHATATVLAAMKAVHPYEEVAYDIQPLANLHPGLGSGVLGEWERPMEEGAFLDRLKTVFGSPAVRHSRLRGKPVRTVALCGGSGAFLIRKAMAAGADAYVTGDVKYHEFFLPDGRMLLADIGHYESERFTPELVKNHLGRILPTFATRLSKTGTNPIHFH
jgi:dinuclear metal center YbgI/SA1388 family protein